MTRRSMLVVGRVAEAVLGHSRDVSRRVSRALRPTEGRYGQALSMIPGEERNRAGRRMVLTEGRRHV
jgi:hypothetical protein